MNADLHMAEDLKNTGKGSLFVIFGEPGITLLTEKDGMLRVKLNGVDVFKPQIGEVVSDGEEVTGQVTGKMTGKAPAEVPEREMPVPAFSMNSMR